MLNTASIGLYPNLVRRREQLQPALGKPLAGVVAMLRTFAAGTPSTLVVDGVRHKLWISTSAAAAIIPATMRRWSDRCSTTACWICA